MKKEFDSQNVRPSPGIASSKKAMQRYFSRIHQRHYRVIKAFLAQSDDLTRSLLQIDTRTFTSFQQRMGAVRSPVS